MNANTSLIDGVWHHIAFVYEFGAESTLYVDGEAVATMVDTPALNFDNVKDYELGNGSYLYWDYLKGEVDELRIWETKRTKNEINENLHLRIGGHEEGLRVVFHFDESDDDAFGEGPFDFWLAFYNVDVGRGEHDEIVVQPLSTLAEVDGSIYLESSASPISLTSPDVSSIELKRINLTTNDEDVLVEGLSLLTSIPYTDRNADSGTPYEYQIKVASAYNPYEYVDVTVPSIGFGTHYAFDGVDDNVTLADPIIGDIGTVEFLVKIAPEDKPSGFSYGLLGRHEASSNNGFVVAHDGGTVWCQFKESGSNTGNLYPTPAQNLADGEWHHVAVTFEVGNSGTLYVDGEAIVTNSLPSFTFTENPLFVGNGPNAFWRPLKGGIDEVVIWDKILSAEEIADRAFVKVRGDANGLLAAYHFDEFTGTTAYDDGLNNEHATINGATIGESSDDTPVQWMGILSSDWDQPLNWNTNAVPSTGSDVTISSALNAPVITSTDAVEVNDLTINSGASLTVESGGILAIKGNVSNNGTFTAKRIPEANGKYSMIGSPLTDADVSDFGADLLAEYDAFTSNYIEGTGSAFPGTGYFAAYFEAAPEIILTGTPNTGEITAPLITSIETPTSYNLVSNPYTAPISYDEFVTENDGAITGAIWLWDDGGENNVISRLGDYVTVNSMGVVAAVGGSTGSSWNGNIGSFQGFFVRTNTNSNLTFKPEMQVTTSGSNDDDHHFRVDEEYPHHSIKLSLSGEGFYNEIIVAVTDAATPGEDHHLDAPKLKGNPQFSFYSWMEDEAFAIQGLPDLQTIEDKRSVELGFDLAEPGDYEIGVVEMKNIPDNYLLTLRDHFLNKEFVIDESSAIPFSVFDATKESKRFELVFRYEQLLIAEDQRVSELFVYTSGEGLLVHFPSQRYEDVAIYSLEGRKVFHEQIKFENQAMIYPSLDPGQMYVLRVGDQSTNFIIH